jgi:hypothetical protein
MLGWGFLFFHPAPMAGNRGSTQALFSKIMGWLWNVFKEYEKTMTTSCHVAPRIPFSSQ